MLTTPAHHTKLSQAVAKLKKIRPDMFFAPARSTLFTMKDQPPTKLTLNAQTGEYLARFDKHTYKLALDSPAGANVTPNVLSSVDIKIWTELTHLLDAECRKNHVIFHGKYFMFDSILKVYSDYELSGHEFDALRGQASAWHNDFQHKFLYKGLYGWCKEFVASRPDAILLAKSDMSDRVNSQKFLYIMLPQLTKPKFDTI